MKNTQRGYMAPLLSLGIIIGSFVLFVAMFWSTYNSYITLEESIVAADRSRQTTLSNLSQTVKETIGIRELAVEDIRKTVTEQIRARAGDAGYKAYVLMLKEHNVAPDPAMYTRIINIIDGGRGRFLQAERDLIDRKQAACVKQRRFPATFILPILNLPSKNIGCNGGPDDFQQIMSERAQETFRTGTDKGLY